MSATEPSFARMAQAIRDGRDREAEQEFCALIQAMLDARDQASARRMQRMLSDSRLGLARSVDQTLRRLRGL